MPGRLVISTEEGVALELSLQGQPVTIGRGSDSTLRVSDRRTSRRHAVIRRTDEGDYEIEDCGSSYGTTLNGRTISRERLRHLDLLVCGGVQVQYHADPDDRKRGGGAGSGKPQGEVLELRGQLKQLIQEHADLRRLLGEKMEELSTAEQQRDEAQDELSRLRPVTQELRSHQAHLEAKIERLGQELLNERGAKAAPPPDTEQMVRLARQLEETQKLAQRHRARAAELEERDAQAAQREQALKNQVARSQEVLAKQEQRAAELLRVVQPALQRIADLQSELEKTRLRLAQAESDLAEWRRVEGG